MRLRAVPPTIAAFTVANLFRLLPLKAASGLGGWIGRTLGPFSRRHRIAVDNLQKALPDLTQAESAAVLARMWDNLGRTMSEYVHLDAFDKLVAAHDDSIVFEGVDQLRAVLREHRRVIFVGAHVGNWELGPLINRLLNVEYVVVYHAIHEPYIDRLISKCRGKISRRLVDNKNGRKAMVAALKKDASLCLLVDQKPRYGPLVPFFGRGVKTPTAPAKLALRYGVPIVPIRVQRRGGVSFKISVFPPIDVAEIGDDDAGVEKVTARINETLEGWVREDPAQWHWVHRRWPDSVK
ncbi:MAG: lysophospholipid acyltransferase family protein [Alphaproteobacteria bacterium]|nr:lysophospholipid acyltransferase family protein [Alphaproteobacteria bacterium]